MYIEYLTRKIEHKILLFFLGLIYHRKEVINFNFTDYTLVANENWAAMIGIYRQVLFRKI
jgi:hypothetical protein